MKPADFVMWMKGAYDVVGPDRAPSLEEWSRVQGALAEAVGELMKQRMLQEQQDAGYKASPQETSDYLKVLYGNKVFTTGTLVGEGASTTAGTFTGSDVDFMAKSDYAQAVSDATESMTKAKRFDIFKKTG